MRANPSSLLPDAPAPALDDVGGFAYGFWQATLDSLSDTIAVLSHLGDIVAVNQAWNDFALANGGAGLGVGDNYLAVCETSAAADRTAGEVAAALREVLEGDREAFECVYPCHAPDEERWFSMRITPFQGSGSRRVVVAHHDITARHLAQRASHDRAALLDTVDAAIIALDLDGNVTQWSAGAEELYGWSAEEVMGKPARELTVGPRSQAKALQIREATLSEGQWEGEFEVRNRAGRSFPVFARNRVLRNSGGAPVGFIGVSVDITQRVRTERQLVGARDFLATVTDTVPDGLYVLDEAGRVTLVNAAAEAMLGWEPGELLGEVMHEKAHSVRPDGSPFPMAECPITRARAAGETVRVEDDIFHRKDGSVLPVSYASAPFVTEDGSPGHVVIFNDITERKERERALRREVEALSWIGRINDALTNDRFVLFAQPIVDLASGETVQHELLIRMIGPSGEIVAPGEFLPVAERHGLITAIDRWVIEQALALAAQGHPVELNVSAPSLSDPTLHTFVRERLAASGVAPELLVFEITETALIDNEGVAQAFVDMVRELGCGVALDDFGTGYGSFRYLKQIPVNVLKIDREFVFDLDGPDHETSRHVVAAVVSLARGLGLKTVAEGVETQDAYDLLRELGVDFVQGYFLARPAPAHEVLGTDDRLPAAPRETITQS